MCFVVSTRSGDMSPSAWLVTGASRSPPWRDVVFMLLLLNSPLQPHTSAYPQSHNSSNAISHRTMPLNPHGTITTLRLNRPMPLLHRQGFDFHNYEYDLINMSAIFKTEPKSVSSSDFLVLMENLTPWKTGRQKRETHSLISPFDMSKMFKKKKYKINSPEEPRPSASLLQAVPSAPFIANIGAQRIVELATNLHSNSSQTANISKNFGPMFKAVTIMETHTFTIPAKILPTESNYEISTKSVKNRKTRPKSKMSRKSKTAPKTSEPNNVRREARLVSKKKHSVNETVWPVKHAAVVEGDIILGGLMMVSLKRNNHYNRYNSTPSFFFVLHLTTSFSSFFSRFPIRSVLSLFNINCS